MGRGHHDQTHGQWGVIPDLESNTGHGIATTSNGGQGGMGHGVATTSTGILAMIPPCPPPDNMHAFQYLAVWLESVDSHACTLYFHTSIYMF